MSNIRNVDRPAPGANTAQIIKENHETSQMHEAKASAKARGKGGRFRGKSGTRENNKARGGKRAL